MKKLLIFVVLFFAAIALSPLLINEKGYILIAMGDYTIESTVVTAALMLVIFIITLLLTLKVFKGGIRLGVGSWHKLTFASQRKGQRNFQQGLTAYLLEDYAQAETLLAKSAEPARQEVNAYLLAASASNKQKRGSHTDHYLKQLTEYHLKHNKDNLPTTLVALKLLMENKNFSQARILINEYHKYIGHDDRLLAIEIELCIQENRYLTAIEYLPRARKSKSLTSDRVSKWERDIYFPYFSELITKENSQSLISYWQKLPTKLKQSENIALAYCKVLADNQLNEDLDKVLVPIVKKGANADFIAAIRELPITHPQALIVLVQKHLHKAPHNALWLSSLAHLAVHQKEWNMAEKAFNSLLNLGSNQYDHIDLQVFTRVLLQKGEAEKALNILQALQAL